MTRFVTADLGADFVCWADFTPFSFLAQSIAKFCCI